MPPRDKRPAVAFIRELEVTIWTAGLGHVGEGGLQLKSCTSGQRQELLRRAQESNRTTRSPVPSNFFKDCLQGSGKLIGANDEVYTIDARQFHDPNRSRSGTNHLGQSGPVMLGVAEDPTFGQWFFDHVLGIVSAARRLHGVDKLQVVSFCRAGRHRSVAVAALLEKLLGVFTEWTVRTEHLASWTWRLRTCNLCDECRRPTGTNQQARDRAIFLAQVSFCWAFLAAARQD